MDLGDGPLQASFPETNGPAMDERRSQRANWGIRPSLQSLQAFERTVRRMVDGNDDDPLAPPQQDEQYVDPIRSVWTAILREILQATLVWWLVTWLFDSVKTLSSIVWLVYMLRAVYKHARFMR